MLKNTLAIGAAIVALATPMVVASAATLEVGSKAPNLSDVTWIKGEPVSQWESGKVYVLDFWATWCGPCVASIPHVNDMQKQYKDQGVTVIGVAIWPNPRMTPTAEFVEAKGDAMAYHIAGDVDGKTADAFMKAAGQGGIPTAMIIDQKGTIAWIGHPMGGLDEVLPAVVKGDFDAKKFAEEQKVREEKVTVLMGELQSGYEASDWVRLQTASENLMAFDADEFGTLGGVYKYLAMVKQNKPVEAAAWGAQLANTNFATQPDALNMFAWMIVQPDGPLTGDEIDAKLAVMVAEKANSITGGTDANTLDTLARAYFVAGEFTKAVDSEAKAVESADNPAMKQAFEEALATYKEKAGQS